MIYHGGVFGRKIMPSIMHRLNGTKGWFRCLWLERGVDIVVLSGIAGAKNQLIRMPRSWATLVAKGWVDRLGSLGDVISVQRDPSSKSARDYRPAYVGGGAMAHLIAMYRMFPWPRRRKLLLCCLPLGCMSRE
jgi:hypothetical protein